MQQLKIFCFGSLIILKDDQVITQFDTDKARALLVYLVLEQQRSLTRSHLAGLLWSELSEKQALQSLRQTLSIIRKTIGDFSSQQLILTEKDVLRINPEIPVWVDVLAFQNEISKAYQFFQRQDQFHQINFRRLINAFKIKTGIFLDNFSITGAHLFDEWLSLTQESLDHQATQGLTYLVKYYQNRGDYGLARQTIQQILQITPWNEPIHLMLMRLYAIDGQWSAFENQFRLLRKFLMTEIGVEPAPDTIAFYEEVRRLRVTAPILKHTAIIQSNIPDNTSRFIGRKRELDELSNMLADPSCRLITLHGQGGIGKTSLAMELARLHLGVYRDGVFNISLAGVHTCEEFLSELMEVLNVPLLDSDNKLIRLRDYLRNKTLLLVLDNFEQLLEDGDSLQILGELIHSALNVKLLVTSRERINVMGEWVYPVRGMTYPDLPNHINAETIRNFDALTLFQQRAMQVKPEFILDSQTIAAVIQICQLYEGLPLAIELAAADVWSQSCQVIANKINFHWNSISAKASNVPPRYRDLWANLDESWILMDSNLQLTFTRLGIFEDGFPSTAAQTIGLATLDDLTRLVNQSLLQMDAQGRYSMHNVIQQYALEKLTASPFFTEVKSAFVNFYVEFLQERKEESKGKQQKQALDGIQLELRNLKKAWEWIVENKHVDLMVIFLDPLHQFFNIRSRFQEGIDLFTPALEIFDTAQCEVESAICEIASGKLLVKIGSLAHCIRQGMSREMLEKAEKIFIRYSLAQDLAISRSSLADVYLRANEFEHAEEITQENLNYYKQKPDIDGEILTLNTLGLINLRRGKIHEAKQNLQASVDLGRRSDNRRQLIVPLNYLGDIACNEGDYNEAELLFQESLIIASELEDLYQIAIILNNLASVFHVNSQYSEASEMYAKSLAICRQIGDRDGEAIALSNLGEIALVRGDYAGAISLFNQALTISREIGEEYSISVCLNNLAEAYCESGQLERAFENIKEAIQITLKNETLRLLSRFAVTAGRCYQLQGSSDIASQVFQATLAHSTTEYDHRKKAVDYCKQMGIDENPEMDDQHLGDVISKLFGK